MRRRYLHKVLNRVEHMKDLQFIYGLCKLSRPLEPASGRGVGCWREKRDVAGGLRLALPRAPRTNATLRRYVNQEPGSRSHTKLSLHKQLPD